MTESYGGLPVKDKGLASGLAKLYDIKYTYDDSYEKLVDLLEKDVVFSLHWGDEKNSAGKYDANYSVLTSEDAKINFRWAGAWYEAGEKAGIKHTQKYVRNPLLMYYYQENFMRNHAIFAAVIFLFVMVSLYSDHAKTKKARSLALDDEKERIENVLKKTPEKRILTPKRKNKSRVNQKSKKSKKFKRKRR